MPPIKANGDWQKNYPFIRVQTGEYIFTDFLTSKNTLFPTYLIILVGTLIKCIETYSFLLTVLQSYLCLYRVQHVIAEQQIDQCFYWPLLDLPTPSNFPSDFCIPLTFPSHVHCPCVIIECSFIMEAIDHILT